MIKVEAMLCFPYLIIDNTCYQVEKLSNQGNKRISKQMWNLIL